MLQAAQAAEDEQIQRKLMLFLKGADCLLCEFWVSLKRSKGIVVVHRGRF
jgi:hypothetical protein